MLSTGYSVRWSSPFVPVMPSEHERMDESSYDVGHVSMNLVGQTNKSITEIGGYAIHAPTMNVHRGFSGT